MSIVQTHTPIVQASEMSADDLRLTILMIKGILKKGNMIAVKKPICSNKVFILISDEAQ